MFGRNFCRFLVVLAIVWAVNDVFGPKEGEPRANA